MKTIAIIPARKGSKGLANKNTLPLNGHSLITWSIYQAVASKHITTVHVTSDCPEILRISQECGAHCPYLRPEDLAQDGTATEPVMDFALKWYATNGKVFDTVVLLQPTSPIRLDGTIDRALEQFVAEKADSLVSVVPDHHFYWQKNAKNPKPSYDIFCRPRRQDIPPSNYRYRENGSIYVTKYEQFNLHQNRLCGNVSLFEMAAVEGFEIDTPLDFKIAEIISKGLQSEH